MKRSLSAVLSLLLAGSASAQVPVSALSRIGTAAAVAGAVKAVSAGAAVGHVISSGKPLFLNDHVTTDAAGRLQVLLVDETIFTLGPNSDMVLDDFVYDAKTSAGKVSAIISKGAFRFVTGKIAQKDPSKLKIKLAVGTIGVRGSIGVGETGPGGTTIINGGARNPDNHDDSAGIYAESGGRVVNLSQPGVGTHISPDGKVADAGFMTADLNRIMGKLQTQPGKSGRGGEPAGAGKRTATDASGRSTAIGGILASASAQTLDLSNLGDAAAAQGAQFGLATDRVSSWDQVRSVGGIGTYQGTASYPGGTMSVTLDIDFNARTLGGGASIINTTQGTGNIGLISYGSLSGAAQIDLVPHLSGSANFSQADLSLTNKDGIAAKTAVISATFNSGIGPFFSATVNASR